jgi:hypothetical protein
MEQYRGYWISGKGGLVHAFSAESYVAGAIYKQGRGSSIEEVTRFALRSFKVTDQDLAAFFGLELAKMVVDECLIRRPA